MEYKKRKRKYLDELKKTTSHARPKTNVGISDIQNDNFVELKFERNDLLAKVERYVKANPMAHITRNRLTTRRDSHQHGFQLNIQNINNSDTIHKSSSVQNLENCIALIKPKPTLENSTSETIFEFGSPIASSTIKLQQTHSLEKNDVPTNNKNKKCFVGANNYLSDSISNRSRSSSSNIIRSEKQRFPSTSSDKEAKVEPYDKANLMSHITRNRLTTKEDLHQHGFQLNIQNINNSDTIHKSSSVQNLENCIALIKPKPTLENSTSETIFEFGSPIASSTIKLQQTRSLEKNDVPTNNKNKKCFVGANNYLSDSISNRSRSSSSNIIRSEKQRFPSTSSDKEVCKYNCTSIEEEDDLNLSYCMYLEFVNSHCDAMKSLNEEIYQNNDYSINLKNRLHQIKLKHLSTQSEDYYSNLTSSSSPVMNNKSVNTNNLYDMVLSESVSRCSTFNFNPVFSSTHSPDKCDSLSEDSFVGSSRETFHITNMSNLINIGQIGLEFNKEHSYSSEMYSSENSYSQCQRKIIHYQPISPDVMGLDSSRKKSIQNSNNNQESSSENSDISFIYYRKKMF